MYNGLSFSIVVLSSSSFFPIHISVFSNTQDEFGYNDGCDSERSSISSHILLDGVDTVVDFS